MTDPKAPAWRQHVSEHFILHVRPSSTAEGHASLITARLESFHGALAGVLELNNRPPEPVHVVLTETEDEQEDEPGPEQGPCRIQATYRQDSPGEGLERSLVGVLLSRAAGGRLCELPAMVDGLLGYAAGKMADGRRSRERRRAEPQEPAGHVPLQRLLAGPTGTPDARYRQASTAFVTFVLDTYGFESLKRLATRVRPDEPGPAFEEAFGKPLPVLEKEWLGALRGGEKPLAGMMGLLRRLLLLLLPYRLQLLLLLPVLMISISYSVVGPFVMRVFIDDVLLERDAALVPIVAGSLAALLVLTFSGQMGVSYLAARTGLRACTDLRLQLFSRVQRLSLDYLGQQQMGDLLARLTSDVEGVEYALTTALPKAAGSILLILASVALCFVIDWRLAVVALVAAAALYVVPPLIQKRADEASYRRRQDGAQLAATMQENLAALPVIQAFGLQGVALGRLRSQVERLASSGLRLVFLSSLLGTSLSSGGLLLQALLLLAGGALVLTGDLSIGLYYAFMELLYEAQVAIEIMAGLVPPMQQSTGGMQRVQELLDQESAIVDADAAVPLPEIEREIRFDNVTFSYTGTQVNLDRLSLSIPAGKSVGFVGASGSGKSSVVNLLLRFYDPTVGSVSVDGRDLREVSLESLRNQIAIVFQEVFVFNTTVRENIRMGRLDATDGEVEAAAKAAEVHDFVLGLPQGYDTIVGERGGRLSGGQRQRLAIARALVRNPSVLILDEATSALDPHTAASINATLRQLARDRTVISVTHRLASLVDADRLFVLESGRLVEQGTHQELLAGKGTYYRLWEQDTAEASQRAGAVSTDLDRLATIPIFRTLDQDSLTELSSQFVAEHYAAGEIVFEEGDPADKLYIISRGKVQVEVTGPLGERRLLAVLGPGEHFGEMALRQATRRTVTVRTRGPCLLLGLERRHILKRMADILMLPEADRRLVSWILRQGHVGLADVAIYLSVDEDEANERLERLIQRGYVQELQVEDETRFRARMADRRAAKGLPASMWNALA